MRRIALPLALVTSLGLAACRTANVMAGPTPTTQTPQTFVAAGSTILQAGTPLKVQLTDTLSTQDSKVGDQVHTTVVEPIQDAAGKTLVAAGSEVEGTVTELQPSPHAGEPASIRVNFDRLTTSAGTEPITAQVVEAKPEVNPNVGRAGRGAAIGGLGGFAAGAILGQSLGGALLGGVLGAGAGTAISLGTGEVQASLPAGTPMTLQLTQPVNVRPG